VVRRAELAKRLHGSVERFNGRPVGAASEQTSPDSLGLGAQDRRNVARTELKQAFE
jgi:hypothetical protein